MLRNTIIAVLALACASVAYYFTQLVHEAPETADIKPGKCLDVLAPETENDMVSIPAGTFTMGASDYYPDEGPLKEVTLDSFWIDKHEVSNAQFTRFVEETGYVTVAERQPDPALFPGIPEEQLQPGSVVFIMPTDIAMGGRITQWWQFVPGANWRQPTGPGSDIEGKEKYPVVHVAYEDALAYANWLGRELPTEAQWEYAARGGLKLQTYAWGKEFTPGGIWQANTWQGMFPITNSEDDGYVGASPVGCYPENGYGLYDMVGNVWEWVGDWYYPGHNTNELEPEKTGFDPRQPGVPVKVIKGGSYLCAENYCMRYRPAARHAQESSLGAAHIGFRTVKNGT